MQFTGNVERYSLILGSNVDDRDGFKATVGLKIEDKFTTEVLRSMARPFLPNEFSVSCSINSVQ